MSEQIGLVTRITPNVIDRDRDNGGLYFDA